MEVFKQFMKNVYYGRTIQASKVWHENNSSSNSIVHECFEVLLACFSRNFPFGSTSEKAPLAQVCKWLLVPWQEFIGSQSLIQRKITRPKQFLLPVCFLRHRERSQEFSLLRVLWSYPTAIISMVSWPLGKG